jgi:hypothetical protein
VFSGWQRVHTLTWAAGDKQGIELFKYKERRLGSTFRERIEAGKERAGCCIGRRRRTWY